MPIKNIGFACNLKNANPFMPFPLIIRFVHFTGGRLHLLFVKTELKNQEALISETLVRDKLNAIEPVYHAVTNTSIVKAVSDFVKENAIDILLVTPRKHGIWDNLLYKDHAKDLIRLNAIPILALRQKNK